MQENIDMTAYNKEFTKPIIKYGRLINLLCIFLSFLPALVMWFYYGFKPANAEILAGWGLIASIFGIYAVVEPVSYYPVLGLAGTYIGVLSGNISNVRVPASVIAQDAVGTTPGTKKAELVSTIAIAGSIIMNLAIVTIGAIGGATIMGFFPEPVVEAFTYVTPAIFGAIFGMNFVKNFLYGGFALVLAGILVFFTNLPTYVIIPILVFATIVLGLFDHNRKLKNKND